VEQASALDNYYTMVDGMEGEAPPHNMALIQHGGFGKTRMSVEYVCCFGKKPFPGESFGSVP
jgi:hypothetical protein